MMFVEMWTGCGSDPPAFKRNKVLFETLRSDAKSSAVINSPRSGEFSPTHPVWSIVRAVMMHLRVWP
jgi:hypothetical protein